MVKDLFESLLQELGGILKMPNLKPDNNQSCLLKISETLHIQLELDKTGEWLILGANIGVVPQGRYRETIFREALKHNGQRTRLGDFAYSTRNDQLIFLLKLAAPQIQAQDLAETLKNFAVKARSWQEAITHGEVPSVLEGSYQKSKVSSGMFGLK